MLLKRGKWDKKIDYGGEWNSTLLNLSVIIDGATEKVYKIVKPFLEGFFLNAFQKRGKWDKSFDCGGEWRSTFLNLSVIIEGATEKVYKVLKPVLKAIFSECFSKLKKRLAGPKF